MLTTLLALCLAGTPTPGAEAPAPQGPPDVAIFIRRPDQVRIYSADLDVGDPPGKKRSKQDKRLRNGPFVFSGEGTALAVEEAQTLAMSWVPPKTDGSEPLLQCGFNPDIALRFQRGDTFVDAVVCFGCEQIWFFDARGQSFRAGRFDFRILKRMARDAFPKEFGKE